MDFLPEKDERDIKDFFPKSVPDDVEKIKYHYKFSEEGMNKGLQISLLINFNEEEEYLILKKMLTQKNGVRENGFLYKITVDDSSYEIEYQIEK